MAVPSGDTGQPPEDLLLWAGGSEGQGAASASPPRAFQSPSLCGAGQGAGYTRNSCPRRSAKTLRALGPAPRRHHEKHISGGARDIRASSPITPKLGDPPARHLLLCASDPAGRRSQYGQLRRCGEGECLGHLGPSESSRGAQMGEHLGAHGVLPWGVWVHVGSLSWDLRLPWPKQPAQGARQLTRRGNPGPHHPAPGRLPTSPQSLIVGVVRISHCASPAQPTPQVPPTHTHRLECLIGVPHTFQNCPWQDGKDSRP